MTRRTLLLALTLAGTLALPGSAQEAGRPWTTLSLSTCGVDTFAAGHPTWDGRGVIVAILDSGVEINAPGLQTTSDGQRKVIDVQDFTGEGDLFYTRAEPGPAADQVILRDEAGRPVLMRVPRLAQQATDEWYYTWFDEGKFANTSIEDVDDDGRSATRLPVLLTAVYVEGTPTPIWQAAFDRNQNRDVTDEQWLTDFWRQGDHLLLERRRPEAQRQQLSLAVNIFPAEQRLSLHYDAGGHGTHVAGITAGHRLGGQPDFHGVAPGAQVMSLKIGNNAMAGGSTTPGSKLEAFRYAAKIARASGKPVVCNLSYGINSARPGHSEIDNALQQLLIENPELIICSSAGNSGPGLGTIGTPSAASEVLSIAALLPQETARDGRGMPLADHAIAIFSSRGQELLKPDLITPGYATSSVPLFNRGGDLWQGTSMASPYAAGLAARLLSAARQVHPELRVHRHSLHRALQGSGRPLANATVLDYGAGLPDLTRAWSLLEELLPQQAASDPSAFTITTESPMGRGPATVAVFRRLDLPRDPQEFAFQAIFPPVTDVAVQDQFHRRYTVTSTSPWVQPVEETVYLRSTQRATIRVRYDAAVLRTPGLHIGDVELRAEGTPGHWYPDAICRTVVIVPERFDPRSWTWSSTGQIAPPNWMPARQYLYVPPWASAVRFRLGRPAANRLGVRVRSLCLPDGRSVWTGLDLPRDDRRDRIEWTWASKVSGGIIELPVIASEGEAAVPYALFAELVAVHADPAVITQGRGTPPAARLAVTNLLEETLQVTGTAELTGHLLTQTAALGGTAKNVRWTKGVRLGPEHKGVRVTIRFAQEDYLAFTDLHVGLYDSDGKVLRSDAFGEPEGTVTWTRTGRGNQAVEIRLDPAFTERWQPARVEAEVEIELLFAEPVSGTVRAAGSESGTIALPGGTPVELAVRFGAGAPPAGSGQSLAGQLVLSDARQGDVVRTVAVRLE